MKLRIESTETGEAFNLRLETSIDKLKLQVKLFTQIPPQDQILLIGPPFKILDSQYGSNLRLEGKRVFVFNRRILTDDTLEHNRIKLLPFEVSKLQINNDDLVNNIMKSPSPSSQYLLEFERYFQEQLKRGQCYELFIKEVFASCKSAVAQHQVQLDGIDAAILNLKDTYQAVKKPYETLENRLVTQQSAHRVLLENFDSNINKLLDTPLHPALVREMDRLRSEAESNGQQAIAFNNDSPTLFDCIPVERERAYHRQCEESYRKVQDQLQRVRQLYESVAMGVGELSLPVVDFPRLNELIQTLSTELDGESAIINEMRKNYQFVYDIITTASSLDSPLEEVNFAQLMGDMNVARSVASSSGGLVESNQLSSSPSVASLHMSTSRQAPIDLEGLVSDMARRKFNQERQQFLLIMEQRVATVKTIKAEVEDSQNALVRAIYSTMRRIARFQTDIQYRLKRDVEWMRKWTSGHNEYFRHLEHLAQLPDAYQHLLHEIVRRKAYNGVFEGEVAGAIDKIGQLRAGEIRERELFMSSFGLCLPPLFFRIVPTLKDKPPYFNPNVTEEQWLPDVHYDDLNRQELLGLNNSGNYIYSNQQQHQQLSRLTKQSSSTENNSGSDDSSNGGQSLAVNTLNEALPATGSSPSSGPGRMSSQAAIEDLLNGGVRIRSSNTSVMGAESEMETSFANNTPHSTAQRGFNAEGGSVILPAMNANQQVDSYEELLSRYNRQTYENAKLLTIVEDLKRQLIENKTKKARSMSLDAPLPLPTIVETASPETNESVDLTTEDTKDENSQTVALEVDTAVTQTDESPVLQQLIPRQVLSPEDLEMAVQIRVDEIMTAIFEVRRLLDRDPLSKSLMDSLSAYGRLLSDAVELGVFHSERLCVDITATGTNASGGSSQVGAVLREVVQLASKSSQALSQVARHPLISFMDFKVGDIVLFMPQAADNRDVWVAFNSSQPYRFLSDTSLDSFKASSKRGENRKYILGRIVFIDQFTAGDKINPYLLPPGTLFYVCHCEALARRDVSGAVTTPRWSSPIAIKGSSSSRHNAITAVTPDKLSVSLPVPPNITGSTPFTSSSNGSSKIGTQKPTEGGDV